MTYFPHIEQNGILKYLYLKNSSYYNNRKIFSYKASGYNKRLSLYPSYAFDFNDNRYWTDSENENSNVENFLSFCFEKGIAIIKGYEIKASNGGTLPYKWSFSASNNNKKWSYNKTTTHAMNTNDVFYVDWYNGPFKCYRIDFINNTYNNLKTTDVNQIEIFGVYYSQIKTDYNKKTFILELKLLMILFTTK